MADAAPGPYRLTMAKKAGSPKPTPKPDTTGEPSFEEAVERVEDLIESIESGEIGLDESLKAFEEGMGLIKRCRARLDAAEQRVRELIDEDDSGGGDQADA